MRKILNPNLPKQWEIEMFKKGDLRKCQMTTDESFYHVCIMDKLYARII